MTAIGKHGTGRSVGTRGATCRRTNGEPCGNYPKPGTQPPVCDVHLPNPRARANAAVRAAVAPFDPQLPEVHAGEVLLRMLAYAADRQRYYASLLARQHDELGASPTLQQEIDLATFSTYSARGKSGEQIRALHRWEAHWLAETARLAKLALDAGIDERLVRMHEAQVDAVAAVIEMAMRLLGTPVEDERVRQVVHQSVLAVEAGAA